MGGATAALDATIWVTDVTAPVLLTAAVTCGGLRPDAAALLVVAGVLPAAKAVSSPCCSDAEGGTTAAVAQLSLLPVLPLLTRCG